MGMFKRENEEKDDDHDHYNMKMEEKSINWFCVDKQDQCVFISIRLDSHNVPCVCPSPSVSLSLVVRV